MRACKDTLDPMKRIVQNFEEETEKQRFDFRLCENNADIYASRWFAIGATCDVFNVCTSLTAVFHVFHDTRREVSAQKPNLMI